MYNDIDLDNKEIFGIEVDWLSLSNKVFVVTGATGMLGSYVVDSLMMLNKKLPKPLTVIVLVRDEQKCKRIFAHWADDDCFKIKKWDVDDVDIGCPECNILIHAASIPRPVSDCPVDVLKPNVIGTWKLLEYVRTYCKNFEQFIFFSSGAVYGENGSALNVVAPESFVSSVYPEDPQQCYSIGKVAGENICVSFMRQFGIPVKMLRYAHTYGPNMDIKNDPRSFVSFVRSAILGEDIHLLSDGKTMRHFCYVTDATAALFYVLLKGECGIAYNIANPNGKITIGELAKLIAGLSQSSAVKVTTNSSCYNGVKGYAPQKNVYELDISRLSSLGFNPSVTIKDGFNRIMRFIKDRGIKC